MLSLAPVQLDCFPHNDGTVRLKSRIELPKFDPSLANLFRKAVERASSKVFLAERLGQLWHKVTYEEARSKVDSIASALLERGLSADRPILILSGNSIDHGLLTLGCETSAIPVAPISTAYSLQSSDLAKIKHIAELLKPGLIYVSDTGPYLKALKVFDRSVEIVANRNSANLENVTSFDQLQNTRLSYSLARVTSGISENTIAKFLFTSGSTSLPKAVVSTHGMLTANQEQIALLLPYLSENPLVLCDWLPWNHTFGGSFCFNLNQRFAGTLYIDDGKPSPTLAETTVRNITEIRPTTYFNVPAGYSSILPYLERDKERARKFFSRLQMLFYAGASLPKDIWKRLEELSVETTGTKIVMTTGWGSTETAPLSVMQHFLTNGPGVIGVPCPGVEIKLEPSGNKYEIRVKGPNVTRGYWKRDDQSQHAFDKEGFYNSGDAVRFADETDPSKGLIFDGRLAEDFKLTSGTWVQVGNLRTGVLAASSPVMEDIVICGEGHEHIGILVWLNSAGCAKIAGIDPMTPLSELSSHPKVIEYILSSLRKWNANQTGQSTKIARAFLLNDSPSIDANEITDKGSINQRAARERRASDLARLFSNSDANVIVV